MRCSRQPVSLGPVITQTPGIILPYFSPLSNIISIYGHAECIVHESARAKGEVSRSMGRCPISC
jgi:hypothetical protein